jgi:3-keto-L-gulonate-6-phosphate decarboxylase
MIAEWNASPESVAIVGRVLFEEQDPREAVGQLMTRVLRFEAE